MSTCFNINIKIPDSYLYYMKNIDKPKRKKRK